MNDAISRSAVLEILDNEFYMAEQERSESEDEEEMAFNSGEMNCARRSLSKVMNLPALDAVPVVRCKDCSHWGTGFAGETDKIKECQYACYMVGENGYCVYAEAKEDEQ